MISSSATADREISVIDRAHDGTSERYERLARELARPERFARRVISKSFLEAYSEYMEKKPQIHDKPQLARMNIRVCRAFYLPSRKPLDMCRWIVVGQEKNAIQLLPAEPSLHGNAGEVVRSAEDHTAGDHRFRSSRRSVHNKLSKCEEDDPLVMQPIRLEKGRQSGTVLANGSAQRWLPFTP